MISAFFILVPNLSNMTCKFDIRREQHPTRSIVQPIYALIESSIRNIRAYSCILRRLAAADALMNGRRAEANGRSTYGIIPRFFDMSRHRTWYSGKAANRGFQPVCHGITAYHVLLMSRNFRGIKPCLLSTTEGPHRGRLAPQTRPTRPTYATICTYSSLFKPLLT